MAVSDKKLVRSKSGLRMVTAEENASPFLLKEPTWVADNQCLNCMGCKVKFDLVKRRHHCRRCGKCLCGKCCENKVPLPRMSFVDPVRLCGLCAQVTKKENEFFDKHLKLLMKGAVFHVGDGGPGSDSGLTYLCKLSSDSRSIEFDGDEARDPIILNQIDGIKIQTAGTDNMGNVVPSGLSLKYRDACGEMSNALLTVPDGTEQRQATMWTAAMQRAVKLMYESRGDTVSPTTPTGAPLVLQQ